MRFIKEKFQRFQRLDNKGLTLVELVCSMAILSVIGMVISSVLIVSADSYDRSNSEVKVQQEAQLVANQIDDLLIDATADVHFDPSNATLTIKQGSVTHTVVQEGDELYYEKDGVKQLMASGVSSFDVDDSEFAERGYLRLNMDLVRKSQTYPAVFTITARNKDTTAATQILAAIHLPNQIILEPNQDYTLNATTSGLANNNLTWVISGASDSNTHVSGSGLSGTVKVGKDETVSSFKVKVASLELDPTGNPKAKKEVIVYVRRVNAANVTGSLASGQKCMKDAVYSLEAHLSVNNPAKANGADYDADYVNPYTASWQVIEGAAYAHVSASTDPLSATVVLTDDIPESAKVVVQATALHPRGTDGAGNPTNKTGMEYATVTGTYEIKPDPHYVDPTGGGWKRQSSEAQGVIHDMTALKAAVGGTKVEVLYRYRELPSGIWTAWNENLYGDANNSATINLRPLVTGMLEYNKDYYVEALVIIVDDAGNRVWPPVDSPEEDNFKVGGEMKRVGLTYRSDANILNLQGATQNDEATAPTIAVYKDQQFVLMDMESIVGIDTVGTSVDNDINYILEKKQPDGTWKDVTNQNGYEVQKGRTCRVTFRNPEYQNSNYRVKVYIQNMPNNKWNGSEIVKGNPEKISYILYDEETGHNIYYFNT